MDAVDFSDDDCDIVGDDRGSDGSGDEDPEQAAQALREAVDIVRDELPTGDAVEGSVPGADAWASATAEQLLSAARSAPAVADVFLGSRPGELHADGASVNPPGYAWQAMEGNVDPSAD